MHALMKVSRKSIISSLLNRLGNIETILIPFHRETAPLTTYFPPLTTKENEQLYSSREKTLSSQYEGVD